MNIIINNGLGQPSYDQIYTQIKNQIISAKVEENAALPSIRALARQLRISVITTKRAYDQLAAEGFLYTVAGKGFFVAPRNIDLIRAEHLRKIEEHMEEIFALSAPCGLSREELTDIFNVYMEEAFNQ